MGAARHRRITELFQQACELDSDARREFLDRACGSDCRLREEVQSLLQHDQRGLLASDARIAPRTIAALLEESPPTIPGCRILRPLGFGGMGKVYLAEDTALGRLVAVKTILDAHVGDARAVRRLRREARSMAAVEHPHVVRIYSLGQVDGLQYIVMQYVEGENLAERLRRQGRLPVGDALTILEQCVGALEAAWNHGVVHRDVKPGNLLIDQAGEIRVADFGLAKDLHRTEPSGVTPTGLGIGTPHYMSPEQARGSTDLDFRTDVYSLGIVFYEMLAGSPPFVGATPMAIVDQHLHSTIPCLRSIRPDVAGELEQLCEWMTRKRPSDRPESYRAILETIRALDGGAPLTIENGFSRSFVEDEPTDPTSFRAGFVGRESQLGKLDGLLDEALAGRGGVVFVTGEAGSGKTALLTEFVRRSQQRHVDLVAARGHCNPQTGTGDSYHPFREVLGLLTGDVQPHRAGGPVSGEYARRLWTQVPRAVETLVSEGPELLGTFVSGPDLVARAEVHTPGPAGWRLRLQAIAERSARSAPDVARQQAYLFEQVTRMLIELARDRPLLIELEDLHWSDGGSCALLRYLGKRLSGSRLLLVGTFRPGELGASAGESTPLEQTLQALRRTHGDLELPLDGEGTRSFVDALVDRKPNLLGEAFREALFRRTAGHPLFASELLDHLHGQGMLVADAEGRIVEGPELRWDMLPARVEGVIGERLGKLPGELLELLSVASILGDTFLAEALADVRGVGRGEIVGMLSGELDRRHRLIKVEGLRQVDGKRVSIYRFRHVLFQQYLLEQLDPIERAYLHEQVGTALERLFGENLEESATRLAHHFEAARLPDRAIRYLRRAAERAVRLSANEDAIAHVKRGLGLLPQLASKDAVDREELGLQLTLGAPLLATAGPGSPELGAAYRQARELSERVGDASHTFRALFVLVHHHAAKGELVTSVDLAREMVDVAKRTDDPVLVLIAHWARGFTSYYRGLFVEAREQLDRVVSVYDRERHGQLAFAFGMDPAVSSHCLRANILWICGHPEAALRSGELGVSLAREIGHDSTVAHALLQTSGQAFFMGDLARLDARSRELVDLSRRKGAELFLHWGIIARGWYLAETGAHAEGIERQRDGLQGVLAAGSELALVYAKGTLAEAHLKAGEPAQGLALIREAISTAETSGELWCEPELHRLHGALILAAGADADRAEAEACFRNAIRLARIQQARSWELRAATALARSLVDRGRTGRAHRVLRTSIASISPGVTRDLTAAQALLAALG